jgi:cytochrome c oxidase assembly protein subunit 15
LLVPVSTDTGFSPSRIALHRFAIACAIASFILLFVGGLVTSTGSALAVPDWPLAFGKLIPPLEGGIRFEWGHRVMAGAVGILTLCLAIFAAYVEPRRWVRITAFAALALVVLQAVLGGLTVLLLLPLPLAVAHAATAQAFFCLMIVLALFTSPGFGMPDNQTLARGDLRLAVLASVATAAVYLQILAGAVMRHLGAGLAIPDFPTSFGHVIPPFLSTAIEINFAHRCGALVVTVLVISTSITAIHLRKSREILTPAIVMLVCLAAQLALGASTVWSGRAVLPTTAHVAVGGALLAATLVLTLRAYELRAPGEPAQAGRLVRTPAGREQSAAFHDKPGWADADATKAASGGIDRKVSA